MLAILSLDSMGFPHSSVGKEPTCNSGDPGLIPGSGRSAGEGIGYPFQYSWASLVAQLVKNPPAMSEVHLQYGRPGFDPWVGKIPWRRERLPTPVFWPRVFQGHKESDTTEQLHFHFSLSCIGGGNGNSLQCSCLENPRDGGAWWAAVYRVTQSRTRLERFSSKKLLKNYY